MIMQDAASSPDGPGRHRRGVGVHRRRAAAALRGPPRPRGAGGHRRHAWPAPGPRTSTRAWPPAYPDLAFTPYDPADRRRARPGVPRPAPRRQPGDRARAARARSATWSTWPPTSGSRTRRSTPSGTARRTPRPSCCPTSPTGCPSCSATRSRAPPTSPRPGCYPTAAALALAPLVRAGVVETDGIIVDAASGRVRRRPAAEAHHHVLRRRRGLHRLRAPRPPAHARDGAGARRLRAVHAPPRADEPRHPGHLLRPAHGRHAAPTALLDAPAGGLRRRAVRRRTRRARRPPRPRSARTRAHVTARYDERTGRVLAIAAIDNLTKGASGAAVQCANLLLDLPETTGLPIVGVYP